MSHENVDTAWPGAVCVWPCCCFCFEHVCTQLCIHVCLTLFLCRVHKCMQNILFISFSCTHKHTHTQCLCVLTMHTLLPITETAVTLPWPVLLSAHTPWFCTFHKLSWTVGVVEVFWDVMLTSYNCLCLFELCNSVHKHKPLTCCHVPLKWSLRCHFQLIAWGA